ncbi:uncharacterized protein PHACADRAFT_192559 [Phanerochaete carnosa HHB-10118-sp]|uniref:DUF6532 domain-containing protein n=1 Tax=Phanerochaete carnosa (strain HHB-10118-sp) TaxID=650164 RepID=K5WEC5_PHACS|nr:uncharacterized protein PHACADRAFT_192559 [Phanerochaete carnosa HHB-10118-sp]EKM57409.1 hypothetical protein PHACADRAFT_192559 [Phanerochaete carnosa HHB-10118-sp]
MSQACKELMPDCATVHNRVVAVAVYREANPLLPNANFDNSQSFTLSISIDIHEREESEDGAVTNAVIADEESDIAAITLAQNSLDLLLTADNLGPIADSSQKTSKSDNRVHKQKSKHDDKEKAKKKKKKTAAELAAEDCEQPCFENFINTTPAVITFATGGAVALAPVNGYPTAGAPTKQTANNLVGWETMVHLQKRLEYMINSQGTACLNFNNQQMHIANLLRQGMLHLSCNMAFVQGIYPANPCFVIQRDFLIRKAEERSLNKVAAWLRNCIYYARDLGDLCKQCNTLARGGMKGIANIGCAVEYGLDTNKAVDTQLHVGKLVKDLVYIYPGDIMTEHIDGSNPFKHPLIA